MVPTQGTRGIVPTHNRENVETVVGGNTVIFGSETVGIKFSHNLEGVMEIQEKIGPGQQDMSF